MMGPNEGPDRSPRRSIRDARRAHVLHGSSAVVRDRLQRRIDPVRLMRRAHRGADLTRHAAPGDRGCLTLRDASARRRRRRALDRHGPSQRWVQGPAPAGAMSSTLRSNGAARKGGRISGHPSPSGTAEVAALCRTRALAIWMIEQSFIIRLGNGAVRLSPCGGVQPHSPTPDPTRR
jgi:hypothetical protein